MVELCRQKLAEWGDPLTLPQSRTECVSYASGDWPWGGSWKTCNGWKTEWRHVEVELFLVFSGPDNLNQDVKDAVIACAGVATAAGIGVGVATDGAAAVGAAKIAFAACMLKKGFDIGDRYSITVDTRSHWTDWG